jgi:NAD(P)-dependent dehydrogenase (short-subunit alcohol dehydrogenase family)
VSQMRFDGQVILVTGGGRGMGQSHAQFFARRGAKVVVSDIGSALSGVGKDDSVATNAVNAIRTAGGEAVPYTGDLTDEAGARAAVRCALETYGRLDALVHNAGFPSGGSALRNETLEPIDRGLAIHTRAVYAMLSEAGPIMRRQNYGRIVLIGSSAMYGYPKQDSYAASKCSYVGLARSVAGEGEAHNIKINVVNPSAATRMGEGLPDSEFKTWFLKTMKPELVSAVVGLLAHEQCPVSGETFAAAGGRVARVLFSETPGFIKSDLAMEDVRDHMEKILSPEGAIPFANYADSADALMRMLGFTPTQKVAL